jgi:hypothetical protein
MQIEVVGILVKESKRLWEDIPNFLHLNNYDIIYIM